GVIFLDSTGGVVTVIICGYTGCLFGSYPLGVVTDIIGGVTGGIIGGGTSPIGTEIKVVRCVDQTHQLH
ncbi:hypothetical protein ABTA61_19955, partial [Acinetobacter baumannii]